MTQIAVMMKGLSGFQRVVSVMADSPGFWSGLFTKMPPLARASI
jgi:hypothetical protein